MKAVFLDYESLDKNDLDFSQLNAAFDELVLYPSTTTEQVLARIAHADVVISNKVLINAETIAQSKHLKLILISATGTNNVDLDAAKSKGIVVCNCQGYGTSAVAQHTLTLMLALATSLLKYDGAVKNGEWNKSPIFCLLDFPIVELSGKTLGIIGYGELGQAVAKLAEAFAMKVVVGALPSRPQHEERIAFAELLPQVDFLSLHCPLTDETRDLIDAQALDSMKK
jgi:glycerate dehydrogenase